jgi:hypothetical protein
MSEQQQVTEEQFVLSQRMESLARQNAQQALRIADLEAQLALIQAKSQQQEQPQAEEVSDEDYEDVPVDSIN